MAQSSSQASLSMTSPGTKRDAETETRVVLLPGAGPHCQIHRYRDVKHKQ